MGKSSAYTKYLFLGKITGTLTDTEKIELDALFSSDKNAEVEFDAFLHKFPSEDVSQSFNYLNDSQFWADHLPGEIKRLNSRDRNVRILKRTGLVGAIAGVVIITSLYLFNTPTTSPQKKAVAKQNSTIELRLSDGRIIDLNKIKGEINSENLILKNSDGSLSYQNKSAGVGMNSVIVPAGMDYKINLSDGSEVWMNSVTKLDFPSEFMGDKREVTVSGEAYFEVKKNPSRPFIVHLQNATIQVTGTKFNVNTYEEQAEKVALVSGEINFIANNSSVAVKPGNEAVYDASRKDFYMQEFDSKITLSWRNGIVYYDSASLNDISKILARWYGIESKIDNPRLLNKQFGGIINKNESIEVFLDNLKAISKIEGRIEKDGVLHFK